MLSLYTILTMLATFLIGYLFGSIPFGLVIGKVFYKKDIREYGSGNTGGTNAGRVLGKPIGLLTIILDVVKAFLAMLLVKQFAPSYIMISGFGACIGHCYSIFLHFSGGKAVSTIAGYVLALIIFGYLPFYNALVPFLLFMLTLKITKYVSLSSMIMIGSAALIAYFQDAFVATTILILFGLTCWRHKANIKRIKDKTESKVQWL